MQYCLWEREEIMRSFTFLASWAAALYLLCPLSSSAAHSITLGTYNLQPNQANQTIDIYVVGNGAIVQGVDFALTVQDGGTGGGFTGTGPAALVGPTIQNVNITGGVTVFGPNNNGQSNQADT